MVMFSFFSLMCFFYFNVIHVLEKNQTITINPFLIKVVILCSGRRKSVIYFLHNCNTININKDQNICKISFIIQVCTLAFSSFER